MERADGHLEASLRDLNERVNELEGQGDMQGLLDAYLNRGSVLLLMDLRTSALEDFESAEELAYLLESEGESIDTGSFVKLHASIASLLASQNDDPVEDYYLIASRMGSIVPGIRHYDQRAIVRLCIDALDDLLAYEHPEDCEPFVTKGLEVALDRDHWSSNRRIDILNLAAMHDELNDVRSAMACYTEAIEIGTGLMEAGALEDTDVLILSLVLRAECHDSLGNDELTIVDLGVAIQILESMLEAHLLKDTEILVNAHHDLAGVLMKVGRVEEAERHLIRAMEVGVGVASGSIGVDPGE